MESLDSISEVDMVSASLFRVAGRGVHTGPALGQSSEFAESHNFPGGWTVPHLMLQMGQGGLDTCQKPPIGMKQSQMTKLIFLLQGPVSWQRDVFSRQRLSNIYSRVQLCSCQVARHILLLRILSGCGNTKEADMFPKFPFFSGFR